MLLKNFRNWFIRFINWIIEIQWLVYVLIIIFIPIFYRFFPRFSNIELFQWTGIVLEGIGIIMVICTLNEKLKILTGKCIIIWVHGLLKKFPTQFKPKNYHMNMESGIFATSWAEATLTVKRKDDDMDAKIKYLEDRIENMQKDAVLRENKVNKRIDNIESKTNNRFLTSEQRVNVLGENLIAVAVSNPLKELFGLFCYLLVCFMDQFLKLSQE